MKTVKAERICCHPEMRPTHWNEPQPKPCVVRELCECGDNWICPVCGQGGGAYTCHCTPNTAVSGDGVADVH